MLDLGRGVHRYLLASVAGRGGSYSLGYSAPARSAGGWPVPRRGCLGVEGLASLPRRAVHGFVGHDHTVSAVPVDLADPLDDPALPPLTTDAYPHRGVAGGGGRFFQAMPGPAGVEDRIAHHARVSRIDLRATRCGPACVGGLREKLSPALTPGWRRRRRRLRIAQFSSGWRRGTSVRTHP